GRSPYTARQVAAERPDSKAGGDMTLKYSQTPVLHYGDSPRTDWRAERWKDRFPCDARPIAEAPQTSSKPVIVYEPDGTAWHSLYYRGQWQKLVSERDPSTGETRTRMSGEAVANPVLFTTG